MNYEHSIKMRTMPVGRLITIMSLPAMFSMLIQALYNIVDTVYVSKIDETNDFYMTALGYAFPIQILLLAFSLGIGIGTNVMVAKKLGEQNKDEASDIARTGIAMAIIGAIVFFLLSFIIVKPFMKYMSNNDIIISAGIDYLTIILLFSSFSIMEIVLTKILQGMGRMIVPMFAQLIGAITNIILDPIFIFGLGFIPAMGVKGAAIATVISQGFALLFVLCIIIFGKNEIHLGLKKFKFKSKYVLSIVQIGLPSMVMNVIGSLANVFLNKILTFHDPSEIANGVLVSYSKLQSFVFMPVFGLNQGGMPILSYNYGAKIKDRFIKTQKILYISSIIILFIGFLIFQFFPKQLLNIFSPTEDLLNMGERALRLISYAFVPAAISIITTVTYQSLGKGFMALIMSLARQAILLVPLASILGKIGGINLVWLSFPIAEAIVALIFTVLVVMIVKKAFIENKEGALNG